MNTPRPTPQILVPRPAEDALVKKLQGCGYNVLAQPLTETVSLVSAKCLSHFTELARGDFRWLVVTSARTVRVLNAAGVSLKVPGSTRIAAVGAATAEALEEQGLRVDFIPQGPGSARALLEEWPTGRAEAGERVLIPGSALSSPILSQGLCEYGYEVVSLPVYTTQALRSVPAPVVTKWQSGEITVAVITAGSNARALRKLLGPVPDHTAVVTIGEPSARACAEVGIRVDAVAENPSAEGISSAIMEVLRKDRS